MNNSDDSWSRCAKEFPTSALTNNELRLTREFDESIMRPVQVERLDFNNRLSSCRGLVATDVALANLEEIEKCELVSKWIAYGICTPPTSEQNTSCPSSPIFTNCVKRAEKLEEESFPGVIENLEKSPTIKCRPEIIVDLTKSPIIGKRRRNSIHGRRRLDKRKLNESSLSALEKSPILGKASYSVRKLRPRIKRRRFLDRLDSDQDSFAHSYLEEKLINSVLRSPETGIGSSGTEESKVKATTEIKEVITPKVESKELSQDIFSQEIIAGSPKIGSSRFTHNWYRGVSSHKIEEEEDLFCSYEEVNEPLKTEDYKIKADQESKHWPSSWKNNEYCSTPVFGSEIKTRKKFFGLNKIGEQSFDRVILDTEEFLLPKIWGRLCPDSNKPKEDDKLLIPDSEFGIEKSKFVTDSERIDDTSSENEGDNLVLKGEKIITGVETDSDKTVSDLIEEPTTQDCSEPLNKVAAKSPQSGVAFSWSRSSVSAASPKISETISSKDLTSPCVSTADISAETTPAHTQEFFVPAPDLLDSAKKKKFRPKKGSLGARLRKLISGRVSSVRVWRHQMSRESAFEGSSVPCTTLLVIEAWVQYGKHLYQSKVLNDPYDLLSGYLDEAANSREKGENSSRNLVVMTNPDFVGSVKLLPGTVFKIYLPWEVFNKNSGPGNLVLHALNFNVVSNPVKTKSELNSTESEEVKHPNEFMGNEVIREYHCPCLETGKVDDSCLTKFSNHEIDIIAEIIK